VNTSLCVCVHMCSHICMHAPLQLEDAYGTCIHPLTAVTLLNKADYVFFGLRLLNGILLSDVTPYRPNQSTHKLLSNHLFIHM
jgi:hypothetical protein